MRNDRDILSKKRNLEGNFIVCLPKYFIPQII